MTDRFSRNTNEQVSMDYSNNTSATVGESDGRSWGRDFSNNASVSNTFESHNQSSGEISMFRAVIMQALLDIGSNSKRTEDKVAKNQALSWFDIKNKDFLMVCDFANFDPHQTLKNAKRAIANGCKWKKSPASKDDKDSKKSYTTSSQSEIGDAIDTIGNAMENAIEDAIGVSVGGTISNAYKVDCSIGLSC